MDTASYGGVIVQILGCAAPPQRISVTTCEEGGAACSGGQTRRSQGYGPESGNAHAKIVAAVPIVDNVCAEVFHCIDEQCVEDVLE